MQFAASVEPDNEDVKKRLMRSQELRRENKPTVPSTIAEELAINPFMRLGYARTRHALLLPSSLSSTCRRSGAIRAATGADDDEAILQALREMKNAFKATL